MRRFAAFTLVSMLGAAAASAQAPQKPAAAPAQAPAAAPQAPGAASAPAQAQQPPAPPVSDENYTYQSDGRRDPFVSLLTSGVEARTALSHKGEGPAGMSVGEISVRGVLESRGTLIAMVQGPDNKTYLVHAGDKFLDGTIKAITRDGLVVVQDVNDPLSLVKQREIRKLLRSAEDAKK